MPFQFKESEQEIEYQNKLTKIQRLSSPYLDVTFVGGLFHDGGGDGDDSRVGVGVVAVVVVVVLELLVFGCITA